MYLARELRTKDPHRCVLITRTYCSELVRSKGGFPLTFNARCGKHDDLVLALAIAVWRAHGGGNAGWVFLEVMRQRMMGSTASEPRYYVGVDLGQSRDPTAIAVVRRVEPPGPVSEDDSGLRPKPNYAPGSVEGQEEQRRRTDKAAVG